MYVAIETHYIGPSNFRGSRIVATTANGHRVVLSCADSLSSEDNHDRAALALAKQMGWHGKLARGGTKRGNAYVWCENGYNLEAPNYSLVDIPKPAEGAE